MKKTINALLYCLICSFILSCSSPEENIKLDSKTWKADLDGCKGERAKLKGQVEDARLQLVGLNERNIRSLLGKPDTEELLEKSNKIYIYYITPGPTCETGTQKKSESIEALAVRFDALGVVREANVFVD